MVFLAVLPVEVLGFFGENALPKRFTTVEKPYEEEFGG